MQSSLDPDNVVFRRLLTSRVSRVIPPLKSTILGNSAAVTGHVTAIGSGLVDGDSQGNTGRA
jgi:hypothetical protein